MNRYILKPALAVVLTLLLVGGVAMVLIGRGAADRNHYTAYFVNSNGIFPGDEIRILGVPVGKIDTIKPQPDNVRVDFWVNKKYRVPADVQAAILAPSLVTARAIQLVPAYTSGPVLTSGAVIPLERTVVPVEWDDFRKQLEKLTETLQPAQPGGTSPLGAFIDTTADNLRGQGGNIRDALIKMSQAFSALGDHSKDVFGTIRNLSTLVTALQSTTEVMQQLNGNLAAVTGKFSNAPNEIGQAVTQLNTAVGDVQGFLAENTDAVDTTSHQLADVASALGESRDQIEQLLHITPTTVQNFVNIYQPAQGSITGIVALNNFSNPVSFICGAIQAASRLGAEQSAKLCAQYLAPIFKNRQYNMPPVGLNPFVGATARPNELTYSEPWLRPATAAPAPVAAPPAAEVDPPPAAVSTDPNQGLAGMMAPPGGGS